MSWCGRLHVLSLGQHKKEMGGSTYSVPYISDFYYCTETSPRPCSCRNIQTWVPLDGWGIFHILWKTRPSAPSMLQFHPIILNWISISDIWMPDQIFLMSLEKFLKGKCSSGPKVFKNRHFGSSGETEIFPKGRFVLLYLAAYLSGLAFLMRITLGLIITVKENLHALR